MNNNLKWKRCLNFVSKNVTEKELDLFFGPVDPEDEFIRIEDWWTMANILSIAKIFPSVSQARKNGEVNPIPKGFTKYTRGKRAKRKDIFILNLEK